MSHLQRGRDAYERREWRAARDALAAADRDSPLDTADLWRLASSAYLLGDDDGFLSALERSHRLHRDRGEPADAARHAFWIGFHMANKGEPARASGWFGRAARLLADADGEHVERGYLLLPDGLQRLLAGDHDAAAGIASEAAAVAQRFGDRDLLALALHMRGRALLGAARVPEGLALLDEAMVAVATDELSPQVTGLIYCSVIGACRSVHALGRAREWTAALAEWCERQPDMVAYTGECRVYRSELLQLRGAWTDAVEEARRARQRLPDEGPALSLALYQQGEMHRLMGEIDDAENAYRAAHRAGREPQPGLALLRLAQGDDEAAAAAIRRSLSATADPLRRARLLPAYVDIMVAVDDIEDAGRGCEELDELGRTYGSPALAARAAHALGAVALASGDPEAALPHLRAATSAWHELDAPYDAARSRLLLGLACRRMGDDDGAELELDAARSTFQRLGAAPDLARADDLLQERPGGGRTGAHGLTPRELDVLALVATGRTNRAMAEALFISEKTVARHLSNIYGKLGLSSRAAATAFAYEHDLVRPPA